MKMISLNIWGGKIHQPLLDFFNRYNNEIDIFCFQEVYKEGTSHREHLRNMHMNIFAEIQVILKDYQGFFSQTHDGEEGLAVFVKKTIKVESFHHQFVFRWENAMENLDARTMGRLIQVMQFVNRSKQYSIINFHGLWNGGGKTDTPDRLQQSIKVKNIMDELIGRKILAGDFNLKPDTESLAILEKDMRNLIKEYNITSTRSIFYQKPLRFADYILVSREVEVRDFKVLPDEVSDHLPLFLEFN